MSTQTPGQGSVWLIVIGVIGALLAAMVGFLDLMAIPIRTRAFRTGLLHMSLNLVVTGAYIGNFFWRYAGYGHPRSGGHRSAVLSAVSLAALTVSSYLGGKLDTATGFGWPRKPPRPRATRPPVHPTGASPDPPRH